MTPDSAFDFIATPTLPLRAALVHLHTVLSPDEFEEMIGAARGVHERASAHLREFAPGAARGRELHRLLDREIAAATPANVSCRRGCTGCCHYEVEITGDEADLLREAVLGGIAVDRLRLAAQAARERKSPEWARLGAVQNRCVFLGDDGACRVYEDRPSSCRKHLVTSPPAACTTPGAAVAPVPNLAAEILLSAALGLDAVCASLPKLLQAALRNG